MPEMFENKAEFAANSRAIGKDFNTVIGYFRCEKRVHDSIRGSLVNSLREEDEKRTCDGLQPGPVRH